MTPGAMVETALLLGAFVATAGAYGLLYCLSDCWNRPILKIATKLSYALLCAIAVVLVAATELHPGWKVLIAASCAADLMIPPITLRYLKRLHANDKIRNHTRRADRTDRNLSGRLRRA